MRCDALRKNEVPLDIESAIRAMEIPIVERRLPDNIRGTIGTIAGRRAII